MAKSSLRKFVYLSIAAAVLTISVKFIAYLLTGSVGLLSDALESCVNLIAAVIALLMLNLAEKPADANHTYGHTKAEYFSSAIEGGLIVLAAFSIIWSAIPRLFDPQPLENIGFGILIALGASGINLIVSLILIRNGKRYNSITIEADGKHLMTDVITSGGVLAGVGLVKVTGWLILDPIVATIVAMNIIWTGYRLMKQSALGLLDTAIPANESERIIKYLDNITEDNVHYHSLMTRQAGQRKFVSFHLLVPPAWNIKQGHDLVEVIENDIRNLFPGIPVTFCTHIEPAGDPASMLDIHLDRTSNGS